MNGVSWVSGTATGFLELLLESLEIFGALLPVFELLMEDLAFQLLHDSFGSPPFHANAIRGFPLHALSLELTP